MFCTKKFSQIPHMHSHMKMVHSEESTEKCEFCKKSFKSKSYLKTHNNLKHTDEGRFSCEVCPKQFKLPHHLKYHKSVHKTTERHFCNLCPVTFFCKIFSFKTQPRNSLWSKKCFLLCLWYEVFKEWVSEEAYQEDAFRSRGCLHSDLTKWK